MLEAFTNIGSEDVDKRRAAGADIFAHALSNTSELEYTVTRLLRGLESQRVSTRSGSYSTLSAFLKLKKLKASQLREVMAKTLLTDSQTSKKERRLVYVARILACGAIVRAIPADKLFRDESLLNAVLNDLVEMGRKRSTLLDLATPFILHLLSEKELSQDLFDSTVWPALLPLFVKTEVKQETDEVKTEDGEIAKAGPTPTPTLLLIALSCYKREFKTDFEFLNDVDQVVKVLLGQRIINLPELAELLLLNLKKLDTVEDFWTSMISKMRSSNLHFETICTCIQKSVDVGVKQSLLAKQEVIAPILGVFRNDDASEQHNLAIDTLGSLLKWGVDEEGKMGKKERKSVLKALFGKSPNLLHEYQKTIRIVTPFLSQVCSNKDLHVLKSIVEKHLDDDNLNIRMAIVYLQFLSRIAQEKGGDAELKCAVGKRLLAIGFGKETLKLVKHGAVKSENDEEENSEKDDSKLVDDEGEELDENEHITAIACQSFTSLMASAYCPDFLEGIVQYISEDSEVFCKTKDFGKLWKKVVKRMGKTEDPHLKYVLGSYGVASVLDHDKVLKEAQSKVEELLDLEKSEDPIADLIHFLLSVVRDEQLPFNLESLFKKLVVDGKITEGAIQQFAESIDVDITNGVQEGDDDESDSEDESSEEEQEMEVDEAEKDSEDEQEEDSDEEKPKIKKAQPKPGVSKVAEEDAGDDSGSEDDDIDMDEATLDDLKNMDQALAKVFATKKKVKDEGSAELRTLTRTFRLLDILMKRNIQKCHVSIPLMLLLPMLHSLQHSLRGRKPNPNISFRIVTVINKLNAIKKVEDVESVEQGSILTMARDVAAMAKQRKNKVIADVLGDSIIMLTNCYLQSRQRSKGEDVGCVTLLTGLMEIPAFKRSKRKQKFAKLIEEINSSNKKGKRKTAEWLPQTPEKRKKQQKTA